MQKTGHSASPGRAWIITGPTSGFGRRTALRLARHGTVVLVGRDPGKLAEVHAKIQARPGGRAIAVVCDMSDIASVRHAAAEIAALSLPIAGLLNKRASCPCAPAGALRGGTWLSRPTTSGRSRSPRRSSRTTKLVIARTPGSVLWLWVGVRALVRVASAAVSASFCRMRNTGTILPGPVILTWATSASMSALR